MSAGHALVAELITHWCPRLASVVGPLDQLPEPGCGLGCKQTRGDSGRALQVVELPPSEQRTVHVPTCTAAVGGYHERALACTDQHPYRCHPWASLNHLSRHF